MCYMSGSIQMENVYVLKNEAGIWQWLFGKSMTSIILLNIGSSDGFAGITAPLARILPIRIMPNFGLLVSFFGSNSWYLIMTMNSSHMSPTWFLFMLFDLNYLIFTYQNN
ncbi:unnamed protein product [Camellia sinensis]